MEPGHLERGWSEGLSGREVNYPIVLPRVGKHEPSDCVNVCHLHCGSEV